MNIVILDLKIRENRNKITKNDENRVSNMQNGQISVIFLSA